MPPPSLTFEKERILQKKKKSHLENRRFRKTRTKAFCPVKCLSYLPSKVTADPVKGNGVQIGGAKKHNK